MTTRALWAQQRAMASPRAGPPAKISAWCCFEPEEEVLVVDQAIFDHFGIAGGELARRERIERREVRQHQLGLVEGADQVLAVRRIDAGLAADRAIDLRQQRGRHLHEIHAAPGNRGGKAGQIADDAAAQRDDQVAAFEPGREDAFDRLAEEGPGLGALARRQDDLGMAQPGRIERFEQPRQLRLGHRCRR